MINLIPGDPFAYRGTHRKPTTTARTIAKVTALAVPLTLAGLVLVGATPLAAHAAESAAPVNWTHRTCAAFTAYEHHPSAANLDRLVVDSLHLRRSYLAADVAQLLADTVTPKSKAQYVATDAQYVFEDCHNGYGS